MGDYKKQLYDTKRTFKEKGQDLVASALNIKDLSDKIKNLARNSAQERTNMAKFSEDAVSFKLGSEILPDNPKMNQDAYEDTLNHLLLGAYTTSEGGLDLGKRAANALINFREGDYFGFGKKSLEDKIDINNNDVGKALAQFRISEAGGGLRGDALQEQLLEDAKMLASSISPFNEREGKIIRKSLYNEKDGLMHQLENYFKVSDRSIKNLMPKLSTRGRDLTDKEQAEIMKQAFKNKGGMIDNQMVKAFAIGGEVTDPISGNEVPEGSFPNEVRDDVPAMLSEGEYVVPADVLRFYGLKFFEDLRENAKIEIARMSQEGRIGGDPIEESQSLNDADVDTLESMMRNAKNGSKGDIQEMAKGGLIDKLAHTIKTDSAINQRLAKGGVVIKMAPGGLVTSNIYQDPTKMDEVIKEVQVAAKNNPALFQRLASKGVVLDKTNATMDSEEMLEENKPKFNIETGEEIVTANEGGLIGYSNGGYQGDLFNPYFYQKPEEDNTVDERYANESGEVITKHYKIVDGIKMLTGYTRDSNPDRKFSIPPLELPAGFNQLLTPSESEMDNLTATSIEDRDGPDDTSPPDTTGWSKDLNMNDPKAVQDWIDNNQKSKMPGILGIALNINNEYRAGVIASLAETSGNKQITSMMKDYLADFKSDPKSITGKIKSLFTTLSPQQRNKYITQQMENFTPDNVGGTISKPKGDAALGFSGGDTGFSFGVPTHGDTGLGTISVGEAGRPSGSNTMSGGSSVSSEKEAPSGADGKTVSGEGIDAAPPGVSSTPSINDKDEPDYADQYSGPFNKGGLAVKKSKPTNKKMNTGGLVQKKKKKNSK